MFEVEVDDFGEGMYFGDLELADEFCEAFFELGIYIYVRINAGFKGWSRRDSQTIGSKLFCPSKLRLL